MTVNCERKREELQEAEETNYPGENNPHILTASWINESVNTYFVNYIDKKHQEKVSCVSEYSIHCTRTNIIFMGKISIKRVFCLLKELIHIPLRLARVKKVAILEAIKIDFLHINARMSRNETIGSKISILGSFDTLY